MKKDLSEKPERGDVKIDVKIKKKLQMEALRLGVHDYALTELGVERVLAITKSMPDDSGLTTLYQVKSVPQPEPPSTQGSPTLDGEVSLESNPDRLSNTYISDLAARAEKLAAEIRGLSNGRGDAGSSQTRDEIVSEAEQAHRLAGAAIAALDESRKNRKGDRERGLRGPKRVKPEPSAGDAKS
jgi:hypothetical protein